MDSLFRREIEYALDLLRDPLSEFRLQRPACSNHVRA